MLKTFIIPVWLKCWYFDVYIIEDLLHCFLKCTNSLCTRIKRCIQLTGKSHIMKPIYTCPYQQCCTVLTCAMTRFEQPVLCYLPSYQLNHLMCIYYEAILYLYMCIILAEPLNWWPHWWTWINLGWIEKEVEVHVAIYTSVTTGAHEGKELTVAKY